MAKILLVEDDIFLIKMYQKKLELAGFEVIVAPNGEMGVAKMKEIKPDLVFMDIMMPKVNGLEAIELAKKDEEIKNIPIVVLSNLSSPTDLDIAKSKGAQKVIIKSEINPGDLVTTANEILKPK